MNNQYEMSKEATISYINKLADMKPSQLIGMEIKWLKAVRPDFQGLTSIFKKYRPLDNGNSKLAKGILSFSLLPVVTCGQQCKGCYDVKSLRYRSVRLKRIVNTLLAIHEPEYLSHLIVEQVRQSYTVTAVRIHVGGDFFSKRYVEAWEDISEQIQKLNPSVKVYTYTKTSYTPELTAAGINVVKSKLDDGRFNFGPVETVKVMAREAKGIVCPATLRDVPDHFCGTGCKACQTMENVFFVAH